MCDFQGHAQPLEAMPSPWQPWCYYGLIVHIMQDYT